MISSTLQATNNICQQNQFKTNSEYKTVATTTAIIEADAGIRIHKMNSHGNYNITITQDWKKVFNDEKNKKLP
jgi:hypothetical protein